MRFCQVDGTPLVDDAPAFDPYATIVAPSGISAAAEPAEPAIAEAEAPAAVEVEAAASETVETAESEAATRIANFPKIETPISEPEDVLDLPEAADPLKTMYVSEDEMRAALASTNVDDEPIIEIPEAPPEPPAFITPEIPTPPPSPFAAEAPTEAAAEPPAPAIPSPFADPSDTEHAPAIVEPPRFTAPEPPPFKEPEPVFAPAVMEPAASSSPAEWTPPPVPDSNWQNQEIGSNTPFQPPPAGTGTQSKGLAIGSLVCGVLSCLCCISVITGPVGVVLGFIARKKASEDPQNFGGEGLAMAGMITGALGFVIGIALIILQVFFGVLSSLAR